MFEDLNDDSFGAQPLVKNYIFKMKLSLAGKNYNLRGHALEMNEVNT